MTTREYCDFLNAALAQRQIEGRKGGVYLAGGNDLLCDTRESSPSSEVGWDGKQFTVLDRKENHPIVCVRWHGAAVYCNWLSAQRKLPACYNTTTWDCDFNKSGFRLPTEAEWEYAARGGQQKPYYNYPWGDDADPAKANVPESKNPYRTGPLPWTTPVGFFSANGFGLYDMAGNVWQWCTEWYERNYYAYSPAENPPGPAEGSPMPDGKAYRCMRGGSWFNGEYGHSRVSNRDPSYFRGPDPITHRTDPDGPYFHIGFRVIRPVNAESRPVIKPTPVQRVAGREGGQGGGSGSQRRSAQARSDDERPPRESQDGVGGAARGFRLLPPRAQEQLNLTDDQQKQIAELETEAKAKLDKILTPDQQQQLQQFRPPPRQGGNESGNHPPSTNPGPRRWSGWRPAAAPGWSASRRWRRWRTPSAAS